MNFLSDLVKKKDAKIRSEAENKIPRRYKVLLFNDDYTPMDFVVRILQKFFYLCLEQATTIMLEVHISGKGVCGIFTYDIAQTKMQLVNEYARNNDYPLLCKIESE